MYRLHILQDSKSRRRGSVEMGKLSSGVSHISHQSMTCSVSRYMWYMHILTWWTHKSSLQLFSPNALQFVPGANNCGFVHRDRGSIVIIMIIITIITKIIIGIQVAIAIIIILHPPKPTMYQFVPLPLPSDQLLPSIGHNLSQDQIYNLT